jgi:hypothetical protein
MELERKDQVSELDRTELWCCGFFSICKEVSIHVVLLSIPYFFHLSPSPRPNLSNSHRNLQTRSLNDTNYIKCLLIVELAEDTRDTIVYPNRKSGEKSLQWSILKMLQFLFHSRHIGLLEPLSSLGMPRVQPCVLGRVSCAIDLIAADTMETRPTGTRRHERTRQSK